MSSHWFTCSNVIRQTCHQTHAPLGIYVLNDIQFPRGVKLEVVSWKLLCRFVGGLAAFLEAHTTVLPPAPVTACLQRLFMAPEVCR